MKKLPKILLNYIVFFGIGAGLVWWQVSSMTAEERSQFVNSLENAHFIYLIPIVIIELLSHYFRALRWKILMDPIKKVSVANTFYAVMIGYLGNTFIPRAGEIFRCSVLTKYEKAPFSAILGTVIAERIFDLLSFAVFIFLTVAIQVGTVKSFLSEKLSLIFQSNEASIPVWIKISVPVLIIVILYFFTSWLFRKYYRTQWVLKIKKIWRDLRAGLSTIFHLQQKNRFFIYTLLIWSCYLVQIYIGFKVINVTENLGIPAAMSVLTLSTIAMMVAPGGLGAFPVAIQQVLKIYNVHNISFGWLVWGMNTILIIVVGLICLALIITQNKGNKSPDPAISPLKFRERTQIEPEEIEHPD